MNIRKKFTDTIHHIIEHIRSNKGFTLIEIMIVITIIAILSAIIIPNVINYPKRARVTATKLQIQQFKTPLELYYNDKGRYPSTEEGLEALVKEGLIKKIPLDPWSNPYHYRYPGEITPDEYEIWSYGADGKEGGEGFNADIKSWEQ
jgi:general secretion pathway protein G